MGSNFQIEQYFPEINLQNLHGNIYVRVNNRRENTRRKTNGKTPCNPSSAALPGNFLTAVTTHGKTNVKKNEFEAASVHNWLILPEPCSVYEHVKRKRNIYVSCCMIVLKREQGEDTDYSHFFFTISTFQHNRTAQNGDILCSLNVFSFTVR